MNDAHVVLHGGVVHGVVKRCDVTNKTF